MTQPANAPETPATTPATPPPEAPAPAPAPRRPGIVDANEIAMRLAKAGELIKLDEAPAEAPAANDNAPAADPDAPMGTSTDAPAPVEGQQAAPEAAPSADGATPPADPSAAPKPKSEWRELDREWGNLRHRKQQLGAREQALAAKEQEISAAQEFLAAVDRGDLVGAHEKLAQRMKKNPSEALAALQAQYAGVLTGGAPSAANDNGPLAVQVQKLEKLTADLEAERAQHRQALEAQQRQQQFEAVAKEETGNVLSLFEREPTEFPALAKLKPEVRSKQVDAAIRHFLNQGYEMSRREALAHVDNYVAQLLGDLGIGDMGGSQAAGVPGAQAKTPPPVNAVPAHNGQKSVAATRNIPTNHDAASSSGARRKLSPDERVKEAAKLIKLSDDEGQ